MDIMEAMQARHSVRSYAKKPLPAELVAKLSAEIAACNDEGGLHIQLVTDEPKAFECRLARYGKFSGVTNYLAMVGKNEPLLDEKCGYYGERLVLLAQQLGLNTCWVGLCYSKVAGAFEVAPGEKLVLVIALGFGETQGVAHKSKPFAKVAAAEGDVPEWFKNGVAAALLAPTAVNQQKFNFVLKGRQVGAAAGMGFYTKVDLGIAKYHFEIAAGKENFDWA
jgi:hypothetical protein